MIDRFVTIILLSRPNLSAREGKLSNAAFLEKEPKLENVPVFESKLEYLLR